MKSQSKQKSPAERTREYLVSHEASKLYKAWASGNKKKFREAVSNLEKLYEGKISSYGFARRDNPDFLKMIETETKFVADVVAKARHLGMNVEKFKIRLTGPTNT